MKVDINITPEILDLVAKIDEFKGRWEALGQISRDHLTSLRKTATIESVGSSTRIEGAKLSDAEVEELLANIEIKEFKSRDEQEVAGYAKAMNMIYDSADHLAISENHIRQLHDLLLSDSTKDERHRGNYKTLDNHVAAFDSEGNQVGIVFQTSSPFDTPEHMRCLTDWYQTSAADVHPLLRVAVFTVRFLAIHPFQDGNGRISRVLTTLQLIKSGYQYVPYASIERIVEDNKQHYYRALRKTQQSFTSTEIDWNSWISFFLRTLWKQCQVLLKKVESHKLMTSASITALGAKVINLIGEYDTMSNRELVSLVGSNSNTMKSTLTKLSKEGFLIKEGSGRATRYRLNK